MFNSFFVILSYFLGSIPFGYIFSKMSGKNALAIGWRKTSGSNVFKNVGVWQGILTGVGDIFKGFLAVYLAKAFDLPVAYQVLCGVAAVTGHNWSIFLRFAGGRGVGTMIGAFLLIQPQALGLAVIPLLALAVIWDAAIGTIFFLVISLIVSFKMGSVETAGIFTVFCFIPIALKRLSPFKELSFKNSAKIWNRLIFDDDVPDFNFRIKRVAKALTKR
ncbi:MAG: glycerol-3-phosphate acyltransferase [bacterium]|nr:glycerol-3-phosphate acyltransferase [bacterium]